MSSWSKWPWSQGWRLCISSATWSSAQQGWPVCSKSWASSLPSVKSNTESSKWPTYPGCSANYLVSGWSYLITFIMEGAAFWFSCNRDLSHEFTFSASNVSSKALISGLTIASSTKWYSLHHSSCDGSIHVLTLLATGCPGKTLFLSMSVRVFPDEIHFESVDSGK